MSPKQPLNFTGKRPQLTPENVAKLAELESRAEARGNAVAGQQANETASSQARKLSPSKPLESLANAARSGTQAAPYKRARDGRETRSTTVHLPVDLHKQLRRKAVDDGVHMSAIIAEAVQEWFARQR
jgi:hypothetical protein